MRKCWDNARAWVTHSQLPHITMSPPPTAFTSPRFNVQISMLARTLRNGSKELSGYSFIFIVTFMAFVQFAFLGKP